MEHPRAHPACREGRPVNIRATIQAEIAGMPPAQALAHVLAYVDWLVPPDDAFRIEGVHLTRSEARILRRLMRGKGEWVPREHLMVALYGHRTVDDWPESNVIECHISNIRRKIAPLGAQTVSEYSCGYALRGKPLMEVKRNGI